MYVIKRQWVKRIAAFDISLCLLFNRTIHRRYVQPLFWWVSRLGDGIFWYSLMLVLPLRYGQIGLQAALHMAMVGAVGLLLYKGIKVGVTRERPFVSHSNICIGAEPLDHHSFPSGHTLHAVGFSIVAIAYFPWFAWLLVPFASLVALSRMILGLHYPSDVLMGASLGALLAWASFQLAWWSGVWPL